MKCWGLNTGGELGLGDKLARGDESGEMGDLLPSVKLGTGRKPIGIGAGSWHTCALLDNHDVKCWGCPGAALGLGDDLAHGDDPSDMGDQLPKVDLGTGRTAIALAVGGDHNCAALDNGTVKCWGMNDDGNLGIGSTIASVGGKPGEMGDKLPAVDLGLP